MVVGMGKVYDLEKEKQKSKDTTKILCLFIINGLVLQTRKFSSNSISIHIGKRLLRIFLM